MAGLPSWLLLHTATIEPYLGDGGHGPQYGPPVEVPCFVEAKTRTVLDPMGQETVSTTTLYAPLTADIAERSRITSGGVIARALAVSRHDGKGLPTPDHVEVMMQ